MMFFFIEYDENVVNDNGEISTISHKLPIESEIPFIYGHEDLKRKPLNFEGLLRHSTKRVPEGILRGCKTITGVSLDSVEEIGNNAFDKCSNLKNVYLSSNLTKIGSCAFQDFGIEPSILDGCINLRSIKIGENTVINLDELGVNLAFQGLKKLINEETGQEQWKISYSDEKGEMYTMQLQGVMSVEAKKAQIVREQNEELVRYFHDQKPSEHFEDMKTGRYCITEPQIGKATVYEPVTAKKNALKQVTKDTKELEQGNIRNSG